MRTRLIWEHGHWIPNSKAGDYSTSSIALLLEGVWALGLSLLTPNKPLINLLLPFERDCLRSLVDPIPTHPI